MCGAPVEVVAPGHCRGLGMVSALISAFSNIRAMVSTRANEGAYGRPSVAQVYTG